MQRVGDIVVRRFRRKWRECRCGRPAAWRVTYLLDNCRTNPGSKGYGRDDVSWCSDEEDYACRRCQRKVERDAPPGMGWCASFPLKHHKHMGFYLERIKEESDGRDF